MLGFCHNVIVFIALFQIDCLYAATAAGWRTRSIYQVFTDRFALTDSSTSAPCSAGFQGYCGGSWKGTIDKLDYIQGMGFTAIWISPIVAQVQDAERGYNGYAATDLYTLNSKFGTESDLIALSKAVHARNMYLMVDVVVNHMGWDGSSQNVDYSTFRPFNDKKYFHNICWINDYDNQTEVENCWLGTTVHPLPDIDTTRVDVRVMFGTWIQSIVSKFSIDGIRLDSVKNVEKEFWSGFTAASGVFNLGEVANGDVDYVCPYQKSLDGLLDYPSFYQATLFFSNSSSSSEDFVKELQHLDNNCLDPTILGTFSENHDQPRFASLTSDLASAKNILTYTLLGGGIPIIYQGQESHLAGGSDPFNREALWVTNNTLSPVPYSTPYSTNSPLYRLIAGLNNLRNTAYGLSPGYATSRSSIVYHDTHNIVYRKGSGDFATVVITNNLGGASTKSKLTLRGHGFAVGIKVIDMISCRTTTVSKEGVLEVEVIDGEPQVYAQQELHQKVACVNAAPRRGVTYTVLTAQAVFLLIGFLLSWW